MVARLGPDGDGLMTAQCRRCGAAFITFPSYIKRRPNGGFCSISCSAATHYTDLCCAVCGAVIGVRLLWRQPRRYCSEACRQAGYLSRLRRRLDERTTKTSGCWIWSGRRHPNGYGSLRAGAEIYAHRIAWMLHYGAIPSKQQVMHLCDHPPCVNPSHLRLGTAKENIRDSIQKGRFSLWHQTGYRLDGRPTRRRLEERL